MVDTHCEQGYVVLNKKVLILTKISLRNQMSHRAEPASVGSVRTKIYTAIVSTGFADVVPFLGIGPSFTPSG